MSRPPLRAIPGGVEAAEQQRHEQASMQLGRLILGYLDQGLVPLRADIVAYAELHHLTIDPDVVINTVLLTRGLTLAAEDALRKGIALADVESALGQMLGGMIANTVTMLRAEAAKKGEPS